MRQDIEEVETSITALTLKAGVLLSCGLLLLGIAVQTIHPVASVPLKPGHILQLPAAILSGSSVAMVHLGLLVLMITPLARIVVLAYEFLREHDYSFAMISLGVLLLLVLSFILGAVE
jgi:uncharacterized membrane protein